MESYFRRPRMIYNKMKVDKFTAMVVKPYFSIIIPTFNRAHLLPKAIKSVLAQSFGDWELIVVDDGSTDTTNELVTEFADQDARIQYHWQENKELNGARNQGIQLATGQYVGFLDDDDLYLPNHLSTLHSCLSQLGSPAVAARTGMWVQLPNQTLSSPLYDPSQQTPVGFIWENPVNLLSFCFHRSILQDIIFDERFILGEDLHFLLRVLCSYPLIQLENFTVVYIQHHESRTQTYYKPSHLANKLSAMEVLWQENEKTLTKQLPKEALKDWYTKQHLHFARAAFRQNNTKLGWQYIWSAANFFSRRDWRALLRTIFFGLTGR